MLLIFRLHNILAVEILRVVNECPWGRGRGWGQVRRNFISIIYN